MLVWNRCADARSCLLNAMNDEGTTEQQSVPRARDFRSQRHPHSGRDGVQLKGMSRRQFEAQLAEIQLTQVHSNGYRYLGRLSDGCPQRMPTITNTTPVSRASHPLPSHTTLLHARIDNTV